MLGGSAVLTLNDALLMVDSFPFRYASVLWAAAIGFVWWGDSLDAWVLLGTGLLVGSGLYLLRQSRRS